MSDEDKMKAFGGMQFDQFSEEDIELLTPIMKRAFLMKTQKGIWMRREGVLMGMVMCKEKKNE